MGGGFDSLLAPLDLFNRVVNPEIFILPFSLVVWLCLSAFLVTSNQLEGYFGSDLLQLQIFAHGEQIASISVFKSVFHFCRRDVISHFIWVHDA
jgi:hypothetical protein